LQPGESYKIDLALASDMSSGSPYAINPRLGAADRPFTIAVMQPYFIPYAGYFRLFAASDLFVIYDCVQFPRRGWVHRNRLIDRSGALRWLTLPLEKLPRDVLIRDLRFASDAPALLARRLQSFRLPAAKEGVQQIIETLGAPEGSPLDYIERLLHEVVRYLGLRWNVIRSSALNLSGALRGQDRVLEIIRMLGARRYVNAPGGRGLYDSAAFAKAGIELHFLPEYRGPTASIVSRIADEEREHLANDFLHIMGAD
jgi:hypothetical protein